MIGTTLGHYRVLEKLGEGGMGVVYRAQDLHLDRPVALKVLPPEKVADPDRKRRFVQEAKAASALNHPHIINIYDIASEGGVDFIAMEYVAGKTLDQLIPRKGMRLTEALKIAVQVADALSAAHAVGIIHRDIKPSNVMVGDQGRVKVLDFGLVKLTGRDDSLASQETTAAGVQTDEGRIVGTVSYMSPEQAQGRPVDARSDIFSFGSLLYEMVSGQRPFQGDSSLHTLAAILEKEPPAVAGDVPHDVQKLITRCLRKDPERRFQLMKDLKVELEELKEESDSGALATMGPVARPRFRWGWAAALVVAAVGLAAGGWLLFSRGDRSLPPPSLVQVTSTSGTKNWPALSPDGKRVAFEWTGEDGQNVDIYVQVIGETAAQPLTKNPAPDEMPVWSPDGLRIAFRRGTSLFTMSALTGSEQKVTDVPDLLSVGSWSPDGTWLAVARDRPAKVEGDDPTGLYLVPVAGGEPVRLTAPKGPLLDRTPRFSWDGRVVAFVRYQPPGFTSALFVQALTREGRAQGNPQQLTDTGMAIGGLAWHRDDRSVLFGGTRGPSRLYRVRLEGGAAPERLEVAGLAANSPSTSPRSDRLVFRLWAFNCDIWRLRLGGTTEPLIQSSLADYSPDFSPDGSRVAFTSTRNGESYEIWIANADGTSPVQLTHGPGDQGTPRWSPDGRWIAFDSRVATGQDIYVIPSDGGQARRLTSELSDENLPSWSRDGRWVYYASGRTGRSEVWRVPLAGGPLEQVTREGGSALQESTDGRMLFYIKSAGGIFARPLAAGPEQKLVASSPYPENAHLFLAVVENGLYYWAPRGSDGRWPLMFFDLSSRKSAEVARFTAARIQQGLTVSPDRKTLLFAVYPTFESNLMLIEHFR